jgi:hypothetical protein
MNSFYTFPTLKPTLRIVIYDGRILPLLASEKKDRQADYKPDQRTDRDFQWFVTLS